MGRRVDENAAKNNAPDPLSQFEAAMAELESIVQSMERGDLKLEDSLKFFERGMALTQQCRASLDSAELKVTNLLEKHRTQAQDNADADA